MKQASTGRPGDWSRLEELAKRLSGRGRARHPGELREFWRLYRGATSRLAALQSEGRADDEEWYLNRLVAAAHAVLYRSAEERSLGRRLAAFLSGGWPRRVREARGLVALATGVFLAGALIGAFYARRDPGFAAMVAPPDLLASVERGEMWTGEFLSIKPAASSAIFANNLSVSILAFAMGITAGVGTLWLLLMNGLTLGAIAHLVAAHGMGAEFWGFVAPHGVLELPAIFIAGAAGLAIGRGMLFPGDAPRTRALVEASRRGLALLVGCGPVLLIAAAIEAWFSPEPMALAVKLAVGGVLAAGLAAYLIRRAHAPGPGRYTRFSILTRR